MAKGPFNGWDTLPASQNGYSYVHGNPVKLVDPTGESPIPIVWCFGIAIAIPDPGMAEGACALFAAGVIGYTWMMVGPDAAQQIADDVVDMADHIAQECIDIVEDAFNKPDQESEPKLVPVPRVQDDDNHTIRVRHYSKDIQSIMRQMIVRPGRNNELFIWAEYPINEYTRSRVVEAQTRFLVTYELDGFVEFNVDTKKWRVEPDPNLAGWVDDAVMIYLYSAGIEYVGKGYPLDTPEADPKFFDEYGSLIK